MSEQQYPHPFIDEKGKVLCQVCGKPYLVITPRHLATHDVTYSEYKLRFPDAPLSSDEFDSLSKFGKEKELFMEQMMKEEVEPDVGEEIYVDEPIYEVEEDTRDLFTKSKDKILEFLQSYFSHMQKDFLIQERTLDGKLQFEFISDFADPILKINFEFPKCFWHNQGATIDPTRNNKLESHGWKVIEINSNAPTAEQIKKVIEKL